MNRMQQFWTEHSEWSQKTFGVDAERGPVGALKHLAKEVQEALEHPTDREEYADCFLLTCDAARRAGMTLDTLLNVAWAKLAKNKTRVWPKPTSDEPSQHVSGIND